MTHFTVMVIGDDWEAQLAAFQENNMGDCPQEYMEFESCEEEEKSNWMSGDTEAVVLEDGTFVHKNDTRFKTIADSDKPYSITYVVPPHLEIKRVPNTERWPVFEQYMKDYCGHNERDEDHGEYGYWFNPDAKWDWYVIGGRWAGFFKVKEILALTSPELIMDKFGYTIEEFYNFVEMYKSSQNKFNTVANKLGAKGKELREEVIKAVKPNLAQHEVGEPGVFMNEAEDGWADQLKKRDIDVEGMYADAMEKAASTYDKFLEVTKDLPVPPKWNEVRAGFEDIKEARDAWAAYPWVAALNKARLMPWGSDAHEAFFVDNGGREAYIENSKCGALVPWSLLMDGTWYEKGEMGWWGMAMNEKLQYDWATQFKLLFDELPDDTLITMVDCHI